MYRTLAVFFWLFNLSYGDFAFATLRSVVVIPGIMGSKLCDQTGKVIWGDRASYTAARLEALRLPFEANSGNSNIQSCGLIESVNIIPLFWESNVYSGLIKYLRDWPAPGFEDTELGVLMEPEVDHGETEIYARV